MSVALESLARCFAGLIPSIAATCSRDGVPNITYVSQIYFVDSRHVAMSCQFFNKTRRNLEENPRATLELYDPVTFEAWLLEVRYARSETEGPLFDAMALRVQAIASHTGMQGVFRLLSADVCEVLSVKKVDGFFDPAAAALPPPAGGRVTSAPVVGELSGLSLISARINRARDLDELLAETLASLDELFGFKHSMVLLPEECPSPGTAQGSAVTTARGASPRLVAIATRGYGGGGIGAEVEMGSGLIGTVAERRRVLRLAGLTTDLRYGRAIRGRVEQNAQARAEGSGAGGDGHLETRPEIRPEIPLPGLTDAQSQLALPLLVQDRLVGVLAVESRDPLCFDAWHETFLEVVGNQIALGIEHMITRDDEDDEPAAPAPVARGPRRTFCLYKNDDCVFVDGEYLIRNIPGKILWKILVEHRQSGRVEFANRELRLDPTLGLPAIKDNLESRLILLRKRLEQKCPDVRLVPTRRGRFALELSCTFELVEKDSG